MNQDNQDLLDLDIDTHQQPSSINTFIQEQNEMDKLGDLKVQLNQPEQQKPDLSARSTMYSQNPQAQTLLDQPNNDNRPLIAFMYCLKVCCLLIYFFFGLFFKDDIILFIMITLLSAVDFYFIKNIAGRLLIGMRWWNEIDANGKEQWYFESHNNTADNQSKIDQQASSAFWKAQVGSTIVWGLIMVIDLLGLKLYWTILTALAFGLSATNLWAFVKCSRHHQNKIKNFASNQISNYGAQLVQSAIFNVRQ